LDAERKLDTKLDQLSALRHECHDNPSASLKDRIRSMETDVEKERENLRILKNDVYREEGN
ncbi:MAG: hypothetical protein K2J87_01380, partial [Muribaculaceae bacterium]|nr:hypothetical protein [Muribaculaceae bacterium]